jgi:hypothetical protein
LTNEISNPKGEPMTAASTPRRTTAINARRRRGALAVIAMVIGLLGAPAIASAHGFYNYLEPGATAPDGTYIVSWSYTPPPPVPDGYASGDYVGAYTCTWSDGFVGTCDGVLEYWGF